jgi:hypothetical protein
MGTLRQPKITIVKQTEKKIWLITNLQCLANAKKAVLYMGLLFLCLVIIEKTSLIIIYPLIYKIPAGVYNNFGGNK